MTTENGVVQIRNGQEERKMETSPTPGEEAEDTKCGWFSCAPKCLQRFNTPIWLLIVLSLSNCFQSFTVNGLPGVTMSTLEKRFSFTSTQSSFIASAYEMGTVPALIVCSYIGSRAHRARWNAVGFTMLAFGCVLFIIPHFATDPYIPTSELTGNNLCRNRTGEDLCQTAVQSSSMSGYLALFIIARLIHGLGATPVYTLGVTLMDDSVSRDKFSLFVGIFYGFGVIGPAIGVFLGGFLLGVYTDWYQVNTEELGLDSNDPRWVGAWWVGYAIGGAVCLILVIPLSLFPRDLPGSMEVRKDKRSEAYNADDDNIMDAANSDFSSIKKLPHHFKVLFTNPTFIFLTLFICCDSVIISGFTAYGPKYVETQFSLSSSMAGIMFGIIILPSGAGGTIVGGLIIERLKLTCTQIMKTELIVSCFVIIGVFLYFITCEEVHVAGVTIPYLNGSSTSGISSSCNSMCMCDDVQIDLVCSHDNIRYYSPCHAGCTNMTIDGGKKEYYSCACVNPTSENKVPGSNETCTMPSCSLMPLFMVLFLICTFLIFTCNSMNISATIRSVPAKERSLAIGVQWIFLRLLGTIPGPIIFGAAFDGACEFWPERCGSRGSCMYYDNFKLAMYILLVCISVKVASGVFLIFAWKLYKAPADKEILEVDYDNTAYENTDTSDTIPVDSNCTTTEYKYAGNAEISNNNVPLPIDNGITELHTSDSTKL